MWARIENNVVAEVTDIDPAGRFHPSLIWVECTTDVQQNWLYDGKKFSPPAPVQEVFTVPQSCTNRQGKLALIELGHYTTVTDLLAAIEDPIEKLKAEVEWNAPTFERNSPFLNAVWAQLGGTQEQLDDAFRLAVTL